MVTSATFWARSDSITANNATLNPIKSSGGAGAFPATEIYFESGTIGTNTTGDLTLENGSGGFDPDTTVWIGGVEYQFQYDLTGTLPSNSQVPAALVGKEVSVITVLNYPTSGVNTELFFVTDGSGTQTLMNDIGNGAIPLTGVTTTPNPVCFLRGTLIATPKGEVPVEALKAGDEVLTASGATATVRFAAARELTLMELLLNPDMRPVCIPQGAMGEGLPRADLWVSPQHRVLVRGWEPEMLFGQDEVLVAAKHLKFAPTLRRPARPETVEYFHLMLDSHDIVLSNGIETESLFPGDTAIASLTEDGRAEMARVFPDYAGDWTLYGPTARRTLTAREAEALWTKMAPLGAGEVKAVA
ncbi:Hint domain-containing protein [Defluviimonas salinarum]|uniref:Hint domain-containing protein n=1 Tax=Defluviimonas salinarum TaxID=2992147 RepID=A0ABT3IYM2_9RHOB|nr:Hint domain-containing protein [Defluviimonas salinarum]MCW3780510.1 Hint domain-containing protein [Defluviimonas salinarum]